jgi:L-threonylcarbamoyladenylate synthase
MRLFRIDPHHPDQKLLTQAAGLLLDGACVVVPTDTVYGLAVALDAKGKTDQRRLEALYQLKGRDPHKAIPLLVDSHAALRALSQQLPDYAHDLASRFWPGPLTLIVKAAEILPSVYCAEDGSVALRMPDCSVTRTLIKIVGTPLAVTSANKQGQAPAVSLETLDQELAEAVAGVIDSGPTLCAQPSTIISCLGAGPEIIRAGTIVL